MSKNAQDTRQRIISEASLLFAEHGFEATSMRLIATRVGIREPSIYAHFKNKLSIYEAVIDDALQPFFAEVISWGDANQSLSSVLDTPMNLMNLHKRNQQGARLLHREFTAAPEQMSAKIVEWMEQFVAPAEALNISLGKEQAARNKRQLMINSIALTNVTLGFFATQGMQKRLLKDEYDADVIFNDYVKVVSKIFKSLII